ncbi:hypothetical protein DFJ58DRAFT_726492 [Suillus subalutaceus]|uniref:uncharacterized protein n=1 Tax=Suillus subalutaceus TaxID=48586 RepID=UPI001B86FB2F|nr:uncharacterized protein DFJ58DRAFT_726492 [Suillus subalutaceus]KAG1859036.1 hypothetical protein DFJ58DRAFT_726492 [Suillus subalutaceus]
MSMIEILGVPTPMLVIQKNCLLGPYLVSYCEDPMHEIKKIASHFASRRTELASMSDAYPLRESLDRISPTKSRGTLLAAEFQTLYGSDVATSPRTPPVISASHALVLLEADIQTCILDWRHAIARSTTSSHRKTCDALTNHALKRAQHLFHAGASVLKFG